MGVVETVLHDAQPRRLPGFVELEDAAIGRVVVLREVGDVAQRLLERHPHHAMAFAAAERLDGDALAGIAAWPLRDAHASPVAGIGPAVIGADDVAAIEPALAELGGAMAT